MTKPKATPERQTLIAILAATLPSQASARRFTKYAAFAADEAAIREAHRVQQKYAKKGKKP